MPPESAALVTGGARRIGAHLVRVLAGRGYAVAIHYRGSAAEAETLAAGDRARRRQGGRDPERSGRSGAARRARGGGAGSVGPIRVLVNSAAIFEPDRAADFSLARWDRQLAINLRAPVVLAREFARLLPGDASGLVVNLLDQRIAAPSRGYFSYTVSKLALAAATELLATALAPRVRVNGIAPGLTLISGAQTEADFERLIHRTPLGKGSSLEAIAQALVYFLEADAVTGQILFVDGGRRLVGRVPDDPAMVGDSRPRPD